MTRLALLWHMHQPFYQDLATGEHILPWVRLHALKDYRGMVALLEEFPRVKATFNLVPSLLVQVQAFAEDRARDRHLIIGLKDAPTLTRDERRFLVGNGFHVPYDRMIRPYPRYAELHARRHDADGFSVDEIRDLQVWQKLVWIDPDWLTTDARLQRLVTVGRGFTEADKAELRTVELELLNAVIPAYQHAAALGQVELSTSPFYHPILPLLCDSDVHFRAQPHSALPRGLAAWPHAAHEQISRALMFHREWFGDAPAGMWPSEGAVSDAVFALFAESGIRWTATDEEILARSLERAVGASQLYRPYEVGPAGKSVRCLFRDHRLSDLIGFAYQSWGAERAADDFLTQVREAGRRFRSDPAATDAPVVTVILDGENAWEHYPGGGRPFLRALYGKLGNATDIATVTMSEAVAGPAERLSRVFPGSWINGDFYIWAGHADDHRAWRQLADAHARFDERSAAVSPEARAVAAEELRIAEGSDWFWWYGDDHSSEQDAEFDDLFRRHLRNCHGALGLVPPDELFASNISTGGSKLTPVTFRSLDTPGLDPTMAHVGDWARATMVPLRGSGGTMHQVSSLIKGWRLAVDRSAVYIRLDGEDLVHQLQNAATLDLLVERPRPGRLRIYPADQPAVISTLGSWVTVGLPFRLLGSQAGDRVQFSILLSDRDGRVLEQQPAWPVSFDQPNRHLSAANWTV